MLHKRSKNQNLELTILLLLTRKIFFQSTRVLLVRANPAQVRLHKQQIYKAATTTAKTTLIPLCLCAPVRTEAGYFTKHHVPTYCYQKHPQLQRLSTTLSLLKPQTTSGDISCFHSLLSTCPKPCKTPAYKHNSKAFKMKLKSFRWHRRQAWMRTC